MADPKSTLTNVGRTFSRPSTMGSENPYASTASVYARDIISAYAYGVQAQANLVKVASQIKRQATLFDKLTSSGIPYLDSLAELGFDKPYARPPKEINDRLGGGSLEKVREKISGFPTNPNDYNTVNVASSRGVIVPTHRFFAYDTAVEDFLFFQYNFEKYTDRKESNFDESQYLGFQGSREVWVSGGRRTLSFDLFFDATRAGMDERDFFSDLLRSDIESSIKRDPHANIEVSKEGGTLAAVNKLQSFKYPAIRKSDLENINRPRFFNGVFEPSRRFESAPVVLLILGKQVYQGRITSVEAEHQLMNADYIPIRSSCKVSFVVDEWDVHSDVSKKLVSEFNRKITYITHKDDIQLVFNNFPG